MCQIHSPDGATAAVFNKSLISRHFRVSISAKRLIIGSDRRSESKEKLVGSDRAYITVCGSCSNKQTRCRAVCQC